ncbi:hypothetical protein BofuT4_uP024190.1 [Botrytis cinerea T4]|uniref:Uncharacterized protein n=1 Tax=Botryotinia fuckeliana (strain T4) TaxID=999810 RepID=G2YFR2_BOTF4|nr:hypothetical protein BofuT4_uP024190.1 [Botrytis cinerea T4]
MQSGLCESVPVHELHGDLTARRVYCVRIEEEEKEH